MEEDWCKVLAALAGNCRTARAISKKIGKDVSLVEHTLISLTVLSYSSVEGNAFSITNKGREILLKDCDVRTRYYCEPVLSKAIKIGVMTSCLLVGIVAAALGHIGVSTAMLTSVTIAALVIRGIDRLSNRDALKESND